MRVVEKVRSLYDDGMTEVESVKKVIDQFAMTLCPPNTSTSNKRFFPEKKTIRNHLDKCRKNEERSPDDMLNAEMFVSFCFDS